MKKILFYYLFLGFLLPFQLSAQNLIQDWDGNGITVTNSEANKWGWSSTYASATWGQANGSGVRFRDLTNIAQSPSGTYSGREFLYRWDSPYNGSTLAIGIGDGTSTTSTGITLTANSKYTFSGLAEWVNNGAAPTYTFKLSDAQSGGNAVTLGTHSCAAKTTYYPFTFTLQPTTTGTYFIQITQTAGFSGGANLGGIIGLADLSLALNTTPDLIVSKKYVFFDNSTDGLTETFTVSANLSVTDITLTAPAGITLSKTILTPAEAQAGETITATYDNSVNITDGSISISNGTLSDAIIIDAVKDNIAGSWDADGSIDATASIPTASGWALNGTAGSVTWTFANGTSGVRYFDSPSGYTYNTIPYKGRIMYIRWDGTVTTTGIFSLPVTLTAGKTYACKAKYAWNSNATAPIIAMSINAAADNTGTSYGSSSVTTGAYGVLTEGDFQFDVPMNGTYYLTFGANTASLCAIADLAIYKISDGVVSGFEKQSKEAVQVFVNANNQITINAPEKSEYSIYNTTGQLIQLGLISNNTYIVPQLRTGVYIVKVNMLTRKIIIQ